VIKFLHELTNEEVGGKAKGLKLLKKLDLNVPDCFILVHPQIKNLDDSLLKKNLEMLGPGLKAVRSSAVSEDGLNASFAGQFETWLNLESFQEIHEAIGKCIDASKTSRVREYASRVNGADTRISVIIQNMVTAKVSGVVFSAHPVNNRRDKMLISAVEGEGESLVSGKKDAVQYDLFRSGSNIDHEINKKGSLLSATNLKEILEGAAKAEKQSGIPVDMEWAIDHDDRLHWLQVRPITTLDDVHYNELDTIKSEIRDTWTLGNIGEMMPGVITPLTYSVSFHSVDIGLTIWADASGAFSLRNYKGKRYIQMFYNRLFINMSNMMDYPKLVWMNKKENVQFALSGKVFPEMEAEPKANILLRVINLFRQIIAITWTKRRVNKLLRMAEDHSIILTGNLENDYRALAKGRDELSEAFGHHIISSSQSGTLYSVLMGILTENKRLPTAEDHHVAAILLTDISGIESADAVKSLEKFATIIRENKAFAELFTNVSPAEGLRMIIGNSSPEITNAFQSFISRHGHRCIRESELREKTWEENPVQLIHLLQTNVRSGGATHTHENISVRIDSILKEIPPLKRSIIRMILKTARRSVARREITKSASIKVLSTLRKAYQSYAATLVSAGLLDDPDQIYFLTHEEIHLLITDKDPNWKKKATKRRNLLPETSKLKFDEICFGIPEPIEEEHIPEIKDGQLSGIPVSSGIVEGIVRIIETPEDADRIRQGEIMVASFTDIGWTPYFSIIAGLITEIGSPLSHGAVVAREYGIPAIVGAKGAKQFLQDSMRIRLNGDKGTVEIIKN